MPGLMSLINKAVVLFKDISDNIFIIYADKGMKPFAKPLLFVLPSLLFVYSIVYVPLGAKARGEKNELKKFQIIAAHYADYNDAKTNLAAYQRRLPRIKDKDEWLNYIMVSTAKTHKIVFDSISVQTENEFGNFLLVSREVSVTTTYPQFGKWVADIESSPILLKVVEVNLRKDDLHAGMIKVNMRLSTIFPRFGAGGGV